jgi:hypothetical protein
MFVRSRPSRTRAERPIPGDRVLDAFDSALIGAHGAALDLVAAYLSRAGTLEATLAVPRKTRFGPSSIPSWTSNLATHVVPRDEGQS